MYIADLHIHSRYSRATSRDCTPEYLDLWARRKGIQIIGSGDFTHPAWREELKEKLIPAEEGFYILKEEYRIRDEITPDSFIPRFVITGEISSIYKKNNKVRKVHSLILLPNLEEAEIISKKLEQIGNIHSDGRPILGLDCHDLLEILLELCPNSIYIPAHIWTPHFSLFGAFSGFDTVEECFGDLSSHIYAMETGLSSDPAMNWRVSALDRYQLISNSDAHSPAKLGREANLLDISLSYEDLKRAIETGKGLYGTIEFFPEEGKYHLDGHRKCGICLTPQETEKFGGICPVCGRKITIGVSHRIEQLADRAEGYQKENAKKFESLVPLPEVIAASVGHSSQSVSVQKEYQKMLHKLGAEFEILRNVPLDEIKHLSGYRIAEGIERIRLGKVERIAGFDGEYGTIQLFEKEELNSTEGQMDFFSMLGIDRNEKHLKEIKKEDLKEWTRQEKRTIPKDELAKEKKEEEEKREESGKDRKETPLKMELNKEQELAVHAQERIIAVVAGPGTGKTKTLIAHLCDLIENRKIKPSEITAVTFTNYAAAEMRERLKAQVTKKRQINNIQMGTFHAICMAFLKEQGIDFSIIDEAEALERAKEIICQSSLDIKPKKFLEQISLKKSGVEICWDCEMEEAAGLYQRSLQEKQQMDFDDLLLETLKIVEADSSTHLRKPFSYLLTDEFQDINPLQYRLIKAWNKGGKELFVIGDPDQAIYGFRGADSKCFERLRQDFEEVRVIELVENYRSTPEILNTALSFISYHSEKERILRANQDAGEKVRLVKAGSPMGEAIFTAKEINRLAGGIGMLEAHEASQKERTIRSFDEIAVLYRTHREGELLEKCLRQEGIPYIKAGRESFLQDETVRGSLHFFRYLEDTEKVSEKEKAISLLWGMEKNEISAVIAQQAQEMFQPLYEKKKPQKFMELWIKEMKLEENEAMKKLADMTGFYKTMPEFSEALCLGTESDLRQCGNKNYKSGAVTLMTLHGSKGLEFPAVILYGVRDGMIPFESENHTTDKEEERRLFYVGMTRAKEELILTSSGEPSQFLDEIPETMIQKEETGKKKKEEKYCQMSLFS